MAVNSLCRGKLALGVMVISVLCGRFGVHAAGTAGVAPALDRGGFTVDLSNAGVIRVTGDSLLHNGSMEEVDAKDQPTG